MKKLLLLSCLFILVGCSDKPVQKKVEKNEDKIVALDKETKDKAAEYAKKFTDNTSGQMEMVFNEQNNSFDIKYIDEKLNNLVKQQADSLDKVETFNSLTILAQSAQTNTDVFSEFDDKISVNLTNPNDENYPLYVIKKDSLEFPASEKAFDGKLPNIISKNMPVILKNANFLFQPKGISDFKQDIGEIHINLNMTEEHINYVGKDTNMKETLSKSAVSLYETNESVYSEKYPIVLINEGKEVLKVDEGQITEENW
ncbi:hypothetical protein P7H41_05540 [Vagococcus fluvialis]|uniref:hypothetical protein n=1 Tax=Vagococcus fluvialis TaxID=2738 RepID=UPI00288FFD8A|nr:hypothetical protein [Vagococcus fluvialis]MDT2781422.1 hypothetical protein [Vagococcus fluvialis]